MVRDISWHPFKPYLSCTSFHGKVTIFKFHSNGEGELTELGGKEEKEEKEPEKEGGNTFSSSG